MKTLDNIKEIIKEISEFGEMNELQIDQYYELIKQEFENPEGKE